MKTNSPRVILAASVLCVALWAQAGALDRFSLRQQAAGAERAAAKKAGGGKAEWKFEGLLKVPQSTLRAVLGDRQLGVTPDNISDPAKLRAAAAAIKKYLFEQGYLNAAVKVRKRRAPAAAGSITFVINEGERARIKELLFEGNKVFGTGQLLDYMKLVNEEHDGRCLPSEAEYDPDAFDRCLRSLGRRLRVKGYLQAKLGEPKKEAVGRDLRITVPVEEGARYRLGDIRVEGATVFSPQQAVEILGLVKGEIADFEAIASGWRRLWRAYADAGYLECYPDIEPFYTPGSGDGTVDYVIELDEGRRFTVSRIEFKGDASAAEVVRRALLLREGDVYSERLFQESLANVNRLGMFGEIFWRMTGGTGTSSGVRLVTNDKTSDLEIVFDLRGGGRRAGRSLIDSYGDLLSLNRWKKFLAQTD